MICRVCDNSVGNREIKVKEMKFGFREEFTYIECSNCGGLQISEVPENLEKYYPENYYSFKFQVKEASLRRFIRKKRDRYALTGKGVIGWLAYQIFPQEKLKVISKLKSGIDPKMKILDVGSGIGSFLYFLRDFGFKNLTGIDPFLKKDIYDNEIKLLKKSIHDLDNENDFDLIRFNHSLEHIFDQVKTLSKVSRILSKDGICIISMPVKTEYIWNLYGASWVDLDAPRHLFLHTIKSYNYLIEKTDLVSKLISFDSTEFQFWGSEQYKRDIPLRSERSYHENPKGSIFKPKEIKKFKKLAKQLNEENLGDQATFYLMKK